MFDLDSEFIVAIWTRGFIWYLPYDCYFDCELFVKIICYVNIDGLNIR